MNDFASRNGVALVVGGNGGLGAPIAAMLRERGARVSVTASPAKGIDATLDWAIRLQADGFRAIPHLSAHQIRDRATLAGLLDRAREGRLTEAFIVGMERHPTDATLDKQGIFHWDGATWKLVSSPAPTLGAGESFVSNLRWVSVHGLARPRP